MVLVLKFIFFMGHNKKKICPAAAPAQTMEKK
jgi:hypothetical protein